MRILAALAVLALAACGADGEPITPTDESPGPGLSMKIEGKAEIGVTG
ncbi:MAG: argininosuccinate lyase [Paracoccaceae bacterium]|nr:argininosuccinate lyase [Paracoccaceae bacterium]